VVQISVARLLPFEDEAATIENWLEDLPLSYARSMVNLRFSERAKDEDSPFISAGVGSPTQLDVFEGENLSVTSKPERWEEGLAFCEQELRKAIEFGFQQAELDEVRADALRSLDEAVEREKTLSSQSFLGQIVSASEDRVVTRLSRRRGARAPSPSPASATPSSARTVARCFLPPTRRAAR
jgi:zinc protease